MRHRSIHFLVVLIWWHCHALTSSKNFRRRVVLSHSEAFVTRLHAANDETLTAMDMQDIINYLSKISDDSQRRDELTRKFDGASPEFAKLFQSELIVVGNQVQEEAKKLAMDPEKNNKERMDEASDSTNASTGSKNDQQQQLWALVDMMVQSKLIIKRNLGNFE